MKCEDCSHAEMCKWIDELEGRGCDFLSQEPCEDAVSRQSVINAIENDCMKGGLGSCFACYNDAQAFRGEIEKLPSVTQKSGKWITLENRFDLGDRVKCSECGQVFVVGDDVSRKYCPNCGAKMESEVNNG